MKKILLTILTLFMLPVSAYAATGDIYYGSTTYPFTIALPIGASSTCILSNGSAPLWSPNCGGTGSGGGSASAATPYGGIQYSILSGTSTILAASSTFVFSTTTGNVGIGSSTPNYPLTIQGVTGGPLVTIYDPTSATNMTFVSSSSQTNTFSFRRIVPTGFGYNIGMANDSTNNLVIQNRSVGGATTNLINVTSVGNVGIGTTTGTQQLIVQNDALINGNLTVNGSVVTTNGSFTSINGNVSANNIQGNIISINNSNCGVFQVFDSQGNAHFCAQLGVADASNTPNNYGTNGQVFTSQFNSGSAVQSAIWQNPFYNATLDGQIPFSTSQLPTFSSNLFWDNTNGRLGISTTTPAGKIGIQDATTTASTTIAWVLSSTTPNFAVLGNGQVTIGTTTSADYAVNIDNTNSPTTGGIKMVVSNSGTGPLFTAVTKGGTALASILSGGSMTLGSAISATVFRVSGNGTVGAPAFNLGAGSTGYWFCGTGLCAGISAATATALTATGFGIGTSTPDSRLDVNGTVRFEGSSTALTSSIGGALTVGTCDAATTSVDATVGSSTVFETTPQTYPGDGFWWFSYYSAPSTITTKVCSSVIGTPVSSTYNVKIIK